MTNNYELKISAKTRLLNFFRLILRTPFLERRLAKKTQGLEISDLWSRLVPPNYLYPPNSRREASRRGIRYSLDISDYMDHSIYFGLEGSVFEELLNILNDQKVIIDVGVNVGNVLMNMAKICPHAQVVGFEPDAKNFQRAVKNLALNSFTNARIINKGLGDAPAQVKLFKVNKHNAGMNRILDSNEQSNEPDMEFDIIDIIRLDDFIDEAGLTRVDLIKIDVEGYELKVLKGAENTLRKFSPELFIELDDDYLRAQNDSAESLILFLTDLGYEIFRAENKVPVDSKTNYGHQHFDILCKRPAA